MFKGLVNSYDLNETFYFGWELFHGQPWPVVFHPDHTPSSRTVVQKYVVTAEQLLKCTFEDLRRTYPYREPQEAMNAQGSESRPGEKQD